MITTVFSWENADDTLSLNNRFKVFLGKGILAGGAINPVSGQLQITLSPYTAISFDGLMVTENVSPTLSIPLDQTSVISVFAQYNLGAPPTTYYAVTEISAFLASPNVNYHIVFGTITVSTPATQITVANINLSRRNTTDTVGRSPFRGHIQNLGQLPQDNPVGTNFPGDFFVINQGNGDAPFIYGWDGAAWQNITNSVQVAADLLTHRQNLFPNEIHLTNNQADAALGSYGSPSAANPYITSTDPRVPTLGQAQALVGSDGSPSSSNLYVTQAYPVAEPTTISYPLPPGGSISISSGNGPFYVGKNGVGTSNSFFALLDYNYERGYVNSIYVAPIITGVFKDPILTVPLDPSVDADSIGFYPNNLYLQVSVAVDTSFRLMYGKKSTLKTLSKAFSVENTPGDEYVPSQVLEKLINIKGRPFDSLVPAREQNINIRSALDYVTSYLGSVFETNITAGNEDFVRLQSEPVIGSFFVKNVGINPIYTFQNTGLINFTYDSTLGRVQYSLPVSLVNVVAGNTFLDGIGNRFQVVAVNPVPNSIHIVSITTGLIPSSINTSVGTPANGSIEKSNNPRDLLLSEMKYCQMIDRFPVRKIYPKNDEYSVPGGQVAHGILRDDGRFEPRVVFYGAFENYTTAFNETYVRCAGVGSIMLTGFVDKFAFLIRRKSNGPSLSVSINGETPTSVSTSIVAGASVSDVVGDAAGPRYERVVIATGLNPSVPTTVNASIASPTSDSLDVYGIEFIRSNSPSQGLLESGVAFQTTSLIQRNSLDTAIPITSSLPVGRGSRTLIAVENDNFLLGNVELNDLDGTSPPSGFSTGLSITGVASTKLNLYRAGDIIYLVPALGSRVIRKITSIVGTTVNLDSNSGFVGSTSIYHIGSLDNTIPGSEELEMVRYQLPGDFINYTDTDFRVPASSGRYVLGSDGMTLIAGDDIQVVKTGFSGAHQAVKINNSGYLVINTLCTRLDVVTNNTSAGILDVSIDGSPTYSYSISGNGSTRRTIFFNSRYQSHEVTLTANTGDILLSEIILFGPYQPTFTGFPNVVADIPTLAGYLNSSPNYTLAPWTFPFGALFFDAFHNLTYLDGFGANANWLITDDFSKSIYGRYIYAVNDAASVRFQFLGSAFELQYILGPDHGIFTVSIDGADLSTYSNIVGTYTGNQVDAYNGTYTRANIGAYGLSYGWHEVTAAIKNPRTKNSLSTDYKMAFIGYWVGNLTNSSATLSWGLSQEGFFTSSVDTRKFIPTEASGVPQETAPSSPARSQRVSVGVGTTSATITFAVPMLDANYSVSVSWMNAVDSNPLFQPIVIQSLSATGFSLSWNSPLDTGNYQLNYNAVAFQ